MINRRAGCMRKTLVRFCEGPGNDCGMAEILWHRRETRRKQSKQTSACSQGGPGLLDKYPLLYILVQHRNPYPPGKVRVQLALPSEQLICYIQT